MFFNFSSVNIQTTGVCSLALAGMLCLGLVSCASQVPVKIEDQSSKAGTIQIELIPGDAYQHTVGWFIFGYTVYPQVAIWIEKTDGAFVKNLYVTAKAENKNWIASPAEGRPEALPVWNHLQKPNADVVASATPTDGTTQDVTPVGGLEPGNYIVKLETNRSYDWNEAYPESVVGVVGQPSVVYQAEIIIGEGSQTKEFLPLGTGSIDGSNGSIQPGLKNLDSALNLFSKLNITINE